MLETDAGPVYLAVWAVWCEPVSGRGSLLNPQRTGFGRKRLWHETHMVTIPP
jgi:hypothetical protein